MCATMHLCECVHMHGRDIEVTKWEEAALRATCVEIMFLLQGEVLETPLSGIIALPGGGKWAQETTSKSVQGSLGSLV